MSESKDIRQTIRYGKKRVKGAIFSLIARENNKNESRLAIVVPRRIGKAVIRNRIKRIFRAAFSKNYDKISEKVDLVVFPSSVCLGAKSGKIAAELSKIF